MSDFAKKMTSRSVRAARTLPGLVVGALLLLAPSHPSAQQNTRPAPAAFPDDLPTIHLLRNPDPAPSFQVRDLDGRLLSPADFQGKVVLLTFWATWCGPCRAEVPDLIALQNQYGDKLQVIGLSVDDGPEEDVRAFVRTRQINYPVAVVPEEVQNRFGGVHGLPTTFLLDSRGRVVQKHVGLRNPLLYDLEIRALLGMPVQAHVETFEDNGQIFLRNAGRASEFPGLDLTKLTPAQKKIVIRRLNEQSCECGCKLTLAQCRFNDTDCQISLGLARKVIDSARGSSETSATPLPR
jgi:thiol-disulfide isomerase/thioredoxin